MPWSGSSRQDPGESILPGRGPLGLCPPLPFAAMSQLLSCRLSWGKESPSPWFKLRGKEFKISLVRKKEQSGGLVA